MSEVRWNWKNQSKWQYSVSHLTEEEAARKTEENITVSHFDILNLTHGKFHSTVEEVLVLFENEGSEKAVWAAEYLRSHVVGHDKGENK
jgi:hypothetical protein